MSTLDSNPSLSLTLRSSRLYWMLLNGAHATAVLVILFTNIQWMWQVITVAAICANAMYLRCTSDWLRHVCQLDYRDGSYRLHFRDGTIVSPVTAKGELITPWLTVLRIEMAGRRRALPLFSDACHPDQLRRLRVLLRCSGTDGS